MRTIMFFLSQHLKETMTAGYRHGNTHTYTDTATYTDTWW